MARAEARRWKAVAGTFGPPPRRPGVVGQQAATPSTPSRERVRRPQQQQPTRDAKAFMDTPEKRSPPEPKAVSSQYMRYADVMQPGDKDAYGESEEAGLRPEIYVVDDVLAEAEETKGMFKELLFEGFRTVEEENRALWKLAEQLRGELAATEERRRWYQSEAEEILAAEGGGSLQDRDEDAYP